MYVLTKGSFKKSDCRQRADNKQKNIENLLKFKIYMHKNPNEFGENSN